MFLVQALDRAGNVTQTLLQAADFAEAARFVGSLNYQGDRMLAIVQQTEVIEFAIVDRHNEAGRFREAWPSVDKALEVAAANPAEYRVSICRMRPDEILDTFGGVEQLGRALLQVNELGALSRGSMVLDPQDAHFKRLFSRLDPDQRQQLVEVVEAMTASQQAADDEIDGDEDQADELQRHYDSGRLAAEQGCYRMVWVGSDDERDAWLRGYDSVGAGSNGSPKTAKKPTPVGVGKIGKQVCSVP